MSAQCNLTAVWRKRRTRTGFTLAELLIAVLILGEIATFTIPKVLNSQQNGTWNSAALEFASTFSTAYQQALQDGLVSSTFGPKDLTPYMNYVSVDTTSTLDDAYTDPTISCYSTANAMCLRLHSGAAIRFATNESFGGTATTNAIRFHFDPDGKVTDGTTNGPGKSVPFFMYYNGRLVDRGSTISGTQNNLSTYGVQPAKTPPWFHWN